jgi:pimeloyl-ACP methyl ester carboxylesterase
MINKEETPRSEPIVLEKQGYFYVGGRYDNPTSPRFVVNHMYVEYQIPRDAENKYPVIMVHGGGQLGTNFTGTPDGREGWRDHFLRKGFAVYVVDQPGRGRSRYLESDYGPQDNYAGIEAIQKLFAATKVFNAWPQARLHTQWPGPGTPGDYVFDQYYAQHFPGMANLTQEQVTVPALIALLDKIGPAVLMTHSQSGAHGWPVADARPNLVKAILAIEPNGPPFYDEANVRLDKPWGIARTPLHFSPPANSPEELNPVQETEPQGPDLFKCWQLGTPRRLVRLQNTPVLVLTGEASFRAQYDHCIADFLKRAGVPTDHIKLADLGIRGNGHMMMLEKNSAEIAAVIVEWLDKRVKRQN